MTLSNRGSEAFDALFEKDTVREISIPSSWNNGTGYLDNGVYDPLPDVEDGSVVKGLDEVGRRVVVLKTRKHNNVVFFERYANDNGLIVWNAKQAAEELLNMFKTIDEYAINTGKFADLVNRMDAE